ncbi:hypothetical protein B9D02_10560 [Pantoea vagans]|nr:hypothetical protein B9D02_10560 [Pantoea vagans]SJZ45667.1 hypothetical protein SAMN03097723_1014 [Pantoea eucalypti]
MTGVESSVRRMDKNAGSVFEQREALARLRASLQGSIYGDFTERPLLPTEKHCFFKIRALTDPSLWVGQKGQERTA